LHTSFNGVETGSITKISFSLGLWLHQEKNRFTLA